MLEGLAPYFVNVCMPFIVDRVIVNIKGPPIRCQKLNWITDYLFSKVAYVGFPGKWHLNRV